jgi:hypothetical protein
MQTIGYLEKFYMYKVASLPLEVTLRHWYFLKQDMVAIIPHCSALVSLDKVYYYGLWKTSHNYMHRSTNQSLK